MTLLQPQTIIRQAKGIKGVLGISIFRDGNIIDCALPGFLEKKEIEEVGKNFMDLLQGLSLAGKTLCKLNIYTKDFIVNIYQASEYTILLMSQRNVNSALMNLTMNAIVKKIEAGEFKDKPLKEIKTENNPTFSDIDSTGTYFNEHLDCIKNAFIDTLGPIGEIVFEDAVVKAKQVKGDDREKLNFLKNILIEEIPDENAKNEFKNKCKLRS